MAGEVLAMNLAQKLHDELDGVADTLNRRVPTPEDLGKLSAEAVRAQFETAAKAWLDMGEEVKGRISQLQGSLDQCDKDLKLIAECAAMIKDKGNMAVAQIDAATALSTEIRKLADDLTAKVK